MFLEQFEAASGWDLFITSSEGMNKPSLSSMERRKCIHTVKALYNKFIMEYIQDILKDMGLESDGSMAAAEISDAEGNEEDDVDDNGHVDATSGANGDGDAGLCTGSTDPSKIWTYQRLRPLRSLWRYHTKNLVGQRQLYLSKRRFEIDLWQLGQCCLINSLCSCVMKLW